MNTDNLQKSISVSIAIIRHQNQILLGWRDQKLAQGGCYEFPGGKVEQGETPEQAVIREVFEEVGIAVQPIKRFATFQYQYPDRLLTLFFILCAVQDVDELKRMDAGWHWIALDGLQNYQFPAANQRIIERLTWSRKIAILTDNNLNFKNQDNKAIKSNVGALYVRLSGEDFKQFVRHQAHLFDQKQLIVRWQDYLNLEQSLQDKTFAVHLNHAELARLAQAKAVDDSKYNEISMSLQGKNLIAACHSELEIKYANTIACDAIFLSPVHATPSHPDQVGMGWDAFASLATLADMPVYALGGIRQADLAAAQAHGAYGVAGIRDFFD